MMNKSKFPDLSGYHKFFSAKNRIVILHKTEHELNFMLSLEAESRVSAYERFELPLINRKSGKIIETACGFKVSLLDGKPAREYVLLSDYLAAHENYAEQIKQLLQRSEGSKIKFRILRYRDVPANFKAEDIPILCRHTNSESGRKDLLLIEGLLNGNTTTTMGALKTTVLDENIVYELLLLGGLEVRSSANRITDSSIVGAGSRWSAIIESIREKGQEVRRQETREG